MTNADANANGNYVTERLDEALSHLIAMRVALCVGGDADAKQPPEPPDALDDALGDDQQAQDARQAVQRALDALGQADGPEAVQGALYAAEEAINMLVVAALDVGWRFGWSAGRGGR